MKNIDGLSPVELTNISIAFLPIFTFCVNELPPVIGGNPIELIPTGKLRFRPCSITTTSFLNTF